MEYKEIGPGIRVYSNVIANYDVEYKDILAILESEDFVWDEPRIIHEGESIIDYDVRKLKTTGIGSSKIHFERSVRSVTPSVRKSDDFGYKGIWRRLANCC